MVVGQGCPGASVVKTERIEWLRRRLTAALLDGRTPSGVWEGALCSSALATAVSACALHRMHPQRYGKAVEKALQWLVDHVNPDGAWGDTPESPANLSTTLLCWAALSASGRPAAARAAAWIEQRTGSLEPQALSDAVLAHYGNDRTFSTPILTLCALSGRLGPLPQAWQYVPQLPFELAALPASWYRRARLPMVSYALPALIAVGWVRHRHLPSRLPGVARLRDRLTPRLLNTLGSVQPEGGGFLEAAPLTAFVTLSLCAAGASSHGVARQGAAFLMRTVRPDGSWPIDTNLKTWVTTQALQSLGGDDPGVLRSLLTPETLMTIRNWLLRIQYRRRHPYTGATPGGWAWTDLSGGVPDADDTAGALIALRLLCGPSDPHWQEVHDAAISGLQWLLDLQNRDGGLPTFCRGWGRLPFDRSCPDLTAHALCAMQAWGDAVEQPLLARMRRASRRAVRYLERTRNPDGSWTPLWFGNALAPGGENRTYGTARVVEALIRHQTDGTFQPHVRTGPLPYGMDTRPMLAKADCWLRANQNSDGGWGGSLNVRSSVEETGLAVQALAGLASPGDPAVARGLAWLERRYADGQVASPAPIGLYFASLWYSEALYPLVFALGAVMRARRRMGAASKNEKGS